MCICQKKTETNNKARVVSGSVFFGWPTWNKIRKSSDDKCFGSLCYMDLYNVYLGCGPLPGFQWQIKFFFSESPNLKIMTLLVVNGILGEETHPMIKSISNLHIVLMEEILLTTWDVQNLVNNGINYQPQLVQDFGTINSRYQLLKIEPPQVD